jgi:chaperone required for assembly of F1-ATPase
VKRLYRDAAATPAEGGFAVTLDGKQVRTPARAALVVAGRALAEAIAAEWQAQGERVDPETMPLTRLASTAIDLVAPRRAEVAAMIAKYAATDLVCYRADGPPELVERQHQAWQPLIDWARDRYSAQLEVATGIMPRAQPAATLAALATHVASYDPWQLAALSLATAACGSLVVALALAEGRLDAEAAFAVAELDASFQIERWGEDSEQTQRRRTLKDDIEAAARFLALTGA